MLYRSIYFGLYHRLANKGANQDVLAIGIFPLLASIGASISTFLPDKCRSYYMHVHHLRNSALVKRSKRNLLESKSITKELIENILNS